MAEKDDGAVVESGDPDELTQEELASFEAYKSGVEPEQPEVAPEDVEAAEDAGQDPAEPAAEPPADQGTLGLDAEAAEIPAATPEADTRGKRVPLDALHAERAKHKSTKEERDHLNDRIAELEQKWARGDERLKILSERTERAQQPVEAVLTPEQELGPAPDPEEDAFGYMRWQSAKIEQLEKTVQKTGEAAGEVGNRIAADDANQAAITKYHADIQQFAAKTPDWAPAYNHLLQMRVAQYEAIGHRRDAIPELVNNEELSLIQGALERGVSPAEMVYNMAVASGYSPAAVEAELSVEAPPAANGATPPPPAPPAAAPPVQSPIDAVVAAEEAATSLSNLGGGSGEPEISLEALSNMSDNEFDAFANQNPAAVNRIARGG